MCWQVTQSRTERAALRALAKIAFVASLLFFGLAANAAAACRDGEQAANSAVVVHQVGLVSSIPAAIMSAAPDQNATRFDCPKSEACCGMGGHAQGTACGIGCGSACSAAACPSLAGLLLSTNVVCLPPFDEAEAVSARPPPEFRPPRNLV